MDLREIPSAGTASGSQFFLIGANVWKLTQLSTRRFIRSLYKFLRNSEFTSTRRRMRRRTGLAGTVCSLTSPHVISSWQFRQVLPQFGDDRIDGS